MTVISISNVTLGNTTIIYVSDPNSWPYQSVRATIIAAALYPTLLIYIALVGAHYYNKDTKPRQQLMAEASENVQTIDHLPW
jgi:hypothetical protein